MGPSKYGVIWGLSAIPIVCLRGSKSVGTLYRGTISAEEPAVNFTTKAITEWTERARKYPGYQPRANWAGEMAEAIRGAEGRVVTLITSEAWDIHELRKPWNRGQYELIPKSAERTLSAYVAAGTELPKVGEYWITSAQPGREWPPEDIPMFLGFVEVARPLPKMLSP